MRLTLESGSTPTCPVVSSDQRTSLAIDLPGERREGTTTIDVLDARPDGTVWLLGTLTTSASPTARTLQVELRRFSVPGSHVLTVEQNGRRLPGAVTVTVMPDRPGKRPGPTRRYLGRGQIA